MRYLIFSSRKNKTKIINLFFYSILWRPAKSKPNVNIVSMKTRAVSILQTSPIIPIASLNLKNLDANIYLDL